MTDLFTQERRHNLKTAPLAIRMRPRSFDEFAGQEHVIGKDSLLRRAIEADKISSIILFGPPGSGKNALAHVISNITKAYFHQINAVASNVEALRKAIEEAKSRLRIQGKRTILFIDEIHRFNKAQQDCLLPDVEEGNVILIGATTHNPFFYIISPLISRSIVVEFKPLKEEDIVKILKNCLKENDRGLGNIKISVDDKTLKFIARVSEGDARKAVNALEIGALTTSADKKDVVNFTIEVAQASMQKKHVVYDKDEDGHYDIISAFIKSMRGSDPDAAVYWLAKMLYAGEDPRFIARRIIICASEDVGNADPQALVVAASALSSVEFVGMPEARIPLAQAAIYVACAPKSNASYAAINEAMADVETEKSLEVPDHLKDAHADGDKLGHGKDYKYAHSFPKHYVDQQYMPSKKAYYKPGELGYEKKIQEHLKWLKSKT